MTYRRWWLADLLGPLRYLCKCIHCGSQFLSVNVYVYLGTNGALICAECHQRIKEQAI